MSEAYWIHGLSHAGAAGAALNILLKASGVRTDWVEGIYWVGTGGGLPPHFSWTGDGLASHHMLHAAGWALAAGERQLLVVGSELDGQVHICLLAGPLAVGRYNLMPQARLGARLAFSPLAPAGFRYALEKTLRPLGLALADVGCWAVEGPAPLCKALPDAALPGQGLAVPALNALVKALGECQQTTGVFFSAGSGGMALASVVERL